MGEPLDAEYILPLRWTDDDGIDELTTYLRQLARSMTVRVVDGSPPEQFVAHAQRWQGIVEHCRPDPYPGRNGKVRGVMTGLRRARAERVVIADDDVRYDERQLHRILALLDDADVVRPQNYFDPLPWHAQWDTARTLMNRAVGSDYPGTFALRPHVLLAAGGYDGDVMFENLEMLRTIRRAGGRERRADDLFVARRPPTAGHFLRQRVRQAYDSLAQPARLVLELALTPFLCVVARRPRHLVGLLALLLGIAEFGRRRKGGRQVFPPTTTFFAPLWVCERAVCAWIAVGRRVSGGMPYADAKLVLAATTRR